MACFRPFFVCSASTGSSITFQKTAVLNNCIHCSPKQPGLIELTETGKQKQRVAYSLNWPVYLAYNVNRSASPKPILPWQLAFHHQQSLTSLNYAWASAMSINGCTSNNYHTMPCGDEDNLYKKQEDYRLGHNHSITSYPIPGLIKQVSMCTHDGFATPHKQTTAYVIYIGGNDLFYALQKYFAHFKWIAFYHTITHEVPDNIQRAIDQLTTYQQQYPDVAYNIFIISCFDAGQSPHVYYSNKSSILRYCSQKLLGWTINSYNHQLMKVFSTSTDDHVYFIDLASEINKLFDSPTYKTTIMKD